MILLVLVLVFASNFVSSWVIPIACVCAYSYACVPSEDQALQSKHKRKHMHKDIYHTWLCWPMKTLDPDYLAPKQFFKMAEGSVVFACACDRVEFRFHLDHPYCLRLCLLLCLRP